MFEASFPKLITTLFLLFFSMPSVAQGPFTLRIGKQTPIIGTWGPMGGTRKPQLSAFFPSEAKEDHVIFYLRAPGGGVFWLGVRKIQWDSSSGVWRANLDLSFYKENLPKTWRWGGALIRRITNQATFSLHLLPEIDLLSQKKSEGLQIQEATSSLQNQKVNPSKEKTTFLFKSKNFLIETDFEKFLTQLVGLKARQIQFEKCSFIQFQEGEVKRLKEGSLPQMDHCPPFKRSISFRNCSFQGVNPFKGLEHSSIAFERVGIFLAGEKLKSFKHKIRIGKSVVKFLSHWDYDWIPNPSNERNLTFPLRKEMFLDLRSVIKGEGRLDDKRIESVGMGWPYPYARGQRGEITMVWHKPLRLGLGLGSLLVFSGLVSCGGGGSIQVGGAGGSDTTPPLSGQITVNNEPGTPGSDQPNKLLVSLKDFRDPESGIDKIEWSLGSQKGISDLQPWTLVVGNQIDHSFDLIPISDFYLNIRATNKAQLVGEVQSKKINSHVIIPYSKKKNGSLDLLGVKVTALDSNASVWIPGDGTQNYPGGWVTPGKYLVELNVPRIHNGTDGTLLGKKIAGRQIFAGIYSFDQKWEGWVGHDFNEPKNVTPTLWGEKKIITLKAGDTLHVSYSPPINGLKNKHNSDGMIVHCVKDKVEFRGGLWGYGFTGWNATLWKRFRKRVKEVSKELTVDYSAYSYGPSVIPYPIPTEYAQTANTSEQTQGTSISRWVYTRAIDYLQNGSLKKGSLEDAKRLVEFYLNNVQHAFLWGISATSRYYSAYGGVWYPPYLNAQFERVLFAAAAFDLDPNYEPLHYLLSLMAQRGNMILPVKGRWTYGNYNVEGGIAAHKDDDAYTKWIWYTMGATNFGFKGGYNIRIWGPSVWARKVLGWPDLSTMQDTLNVVGWGPNKDRHGHVWDARGLGGGWNTFYSGQEIDGAQWLWFAGVFNDSTLARYSRRSYLYRIDPKNVALTKRKTFYGVWCQNRYIPEPMNPSMSKVGTGWVVSYKAVSSSRLAFYRIYFQQIVGGDKILVADGVQGTSYVLSDASKTKLGKGFLRVVAVDKKGNESSLSDPIAIP